MLVIAFLIALVLALYFIYRPWQMNWGATKEEIAQDMPGDEILKEPTFIATRAVTVNAEPKDIWPWIVQIGYRRAGFYSYDRLDNDSIPSARRIIPEFQHLKFGDMIPMTKNQGARVELLEKPTEMLLVFQQSSWIWAWRIYPVDKDKSRLVTRLHNRLDNIFSRTFNELFEIVMMRKCLLGIKERVEAATP